MTLPPCCALVFLAFRCACEPGLREINFFSLHLYFLVSPIYMHVNYADCKWIAQKYFLFYRGKRTKNDIVSLSLRFMALYFLCETARLELLFIGNLLRAGFQDIKNIFVHFLRSTYHILVWHVIRILTTYNDCKAFLSIQDTVCKMLLTYCKKCFF